MKNTAKGLHLLSGYHPYITITAQISANLWLYCGGKKCMFMEDSGKKSQKYANFVRSMGDVDW